MMESEVLGGTALLVLEIPDTLREESRRLPRVIVGLFQRCYRHSPARSAINIVWNENALTAAPARPPPEGGEELAVVQFSDVAGVRHMLTRALQLVSKGQAMGLELRRGYIRLGPHRLLVEGVVKPEVDSSVPSRPVPPPVSSPKVAARDPTAPPSPPQARINSRDRLTPPPSPPLTSSRSSSADSSRGSAHGKSAKSSGKHSQPGAHDDSKPSHNAAPLSDSTVLRLPAVPEPRVVFFSLRRLYVRPDVRGTDAQAGKLPEYPITPYIVFELVRTLAYPRKILILPPSQSAARARQMSNVQVVSCLVEVASPEAATKLISSLQDQVVEFMSHRRIQTSSDTKGSAGEAPGPQVEARFSVQLHLSHKTNRHGVDELQKVITPVGRNDHLIMIVPPLESFDDPRWSKLRERLTPPFPRQWVPDNRHPNQVHGDGGNTRAHPASPLGRSTAGADEPVGNEAGRSTAVKRTRSPEAHGQSRPAPRLETTHTTPPVVSAAPSVVSAAPPVVANTRYLQPPSPVPVAATVVSPTSQSAVRVVSPVAAAAAAVPPPPPPPLMADHLGLLPFGWRPIFSQEYQQVYYAYRDPATGQERTTWERPQLAPGAPSS